MTHGMVGVWLTVVRRSELKAHVRGTEPCHLHVRRRVLRRGRHLARLVRRLRDHALGRGACLAAPQR